MKKIFGVVVSASMVITLLVLPSIQVSAAEGDSVSRVSDSVYEKMRDAGMSEQDIDMLEKHNAEELEFVKEGGLEQKALDDQKYLSLQKEAMGNTDSKVSLASSMLGTYGDILVAYNASSWGINFGYPGHAAIVAIANDRTVESFPANGVQYHTNDWGSRSNVYAMTVKGATATAYNKAASYAATQVGKPYNWNFVNPWAGDKFYCSQLVWKAWKAQGIDVDYVTIDPIVTPMEIAKSGNTSIYYSN
jgi:uncharacterized protein YycO